MSSVNAGTLRGTPNRSQGRGSVPFANNTTHNTTHNTSPAGPSSAIPRPVLENTPAASSEVGGSSLSASRQKQTKRDEAIRRKLENDLSKKKHLTGRARQSRKAPPGTVLALKPSQALQIKPQTTVAEAAQLMAAKREDCVLVTDDDDRIAGIFTAKDLAFRVVGAGLKPNNVTIAEIMTKNPLCARTDTSATDALDLMVRKGFRHLPVMDENQDISGILDITKCFYDAMEKLERAYSSSRRLYDALEGVQSELGTSQPQQIISYVEALRSKMSGPTLESVLNGTPPTTVSVRTSVKEAAQMMKENHTTAVLVTDQGAITGIFTSKDVVLRVIAPGLDPATCSVVRVMTPHPDFAPMDMSIQAALRKMHDGHYLNLPVMNDGGEIVGMVDVLKLTYATLEQINTMGTGDNEGPAWNKFWLSLDHETESMVSGDGSIQHTNHGPRSLMSPDMARSERLVSDSLAPGDSASHVGVDSPRHSAVGITTPELPPGEVPFPFKFKAPSGRVHRLQVTAAHGMAEFVASVTSKLGAEVDAIGGAPVVEDNQLSGGYALSYLDNDGDSVSITTDEDLLEAIVLARQGHRDKVDLFVHDPSEPPVPPAQVPAPESTVVATPPVTRERRKVVEESEEEDSDESEEEEVHARRGRHGHGRTRTAPPPPAQEIVEQVIAGVPNELLLPGAIAMLAVVIMGVFTVSRLSSR
jgi:CBS domain-containing protein